MKTIPSLIWIALPVVLVSCQAAVPTPVASTSTPPGQKETMVAATIYSDQTSTAAVEAVLAASQTAAVPRPTSTDLPTPTPNRFNFDLPASGCWVNSDISVHEGQTVIIRASGEINTWGGRDGSSGDPNGQKGICGAVQCPLQGVGYGALIGRLEDLPPFFVGSMVRYTAAKDGQLSFTVNDWECEDNKGSFAIQVTFP